MACARFVTEAIAFGVRPGPERPRSRQARRDGGRIGEIITRSAKSRVAVLLLTTRSTYSPGGTATTGLVAPIDTPSALVKVRDATTPRGPVRLHCRLPSLVSRST